METHNVTLLSSLWSSQYLSISLYLIAFLSPIVLAHLSSSRKKFQLNYPIRMALAAGFNGPVTTYTEPIQAYRAWKLMVVDGRPMLRGISEAGKVVWLPTTNVAYHHPYIGEECPLGGIHKCGACGFWAYNQWEWLSHSMSHMEVIGVVNLWGDIVVGEAGYRAEKAYPDRLIVVRINTWLTPMRHHGTPEEIVKSLRQTYKVEVDLVESFAKAAHLLPKSLNRSEVVK